jgi:hypothetical protein
LFSCSEDGGETAAAIPLLAVLLAVSAALYVVAVLIGVVITSPFSVEDSHFGIPKTTAEENMF